MRIFVFATMWLCMMGCAPKRGAIEFCAIENGQLDSEPARFNMENRRILGSDTSFEFEALESEVAKGFVSPFPMALPKRGSALRIPEQWELGGYVFTTTKLSERDPDWILIHAQSTDQTGLGRQAQRTSVLYSSARGVLAFRLLSQHDDIQLTQELFFCGTGSLHASSF